MGKEQVRKLAGTDGGNLGGGDGHDGDREELELLRTVI